MSNLALRRAGSKRPSDAMDHYIIDGRSVGRSVDWMDGVSESAEAEAQVLALLLVKMLGWAFQV